MRQAGNCALSISSVFGEHLAERPGVLRQLVAGIHAIGRRHALLSTDDQRAFGPQLIRRHALGVRQHRVGARQPLGLYGGNVWGVAPRGHDLLFDHAPHAVDLLDHGRLVRSLLLDAVDLGGDQAIGLLCRGRALGERQPLGVELAVLDDHVLQRRSGHAGHRRAQRHRHPALAACELLGSARQRALQFLGRHLAHGLREGFGVEVEGLLAIGRGLVHERRKRRRSALSERRCAGQFEQLAQPLGLLRGLLGGFPILQQPHGPAAEAGGQRDHRQRGDHGLRLSLGQGPHPLAEIRIAAQACGPGVVLLPERGEQLAGEFGHQLLAEEPGERVAHLHALDELERRGHLGDGLDHAVGHADEA